jgi:hypothetical protein
MKTYLLSTVGLATSLTQALKVVVISDLHLNLQYHANGTADDNCFTSQGEGDSDLGKWNCDPPIALADKMMAYLAQNGGADADAVVIAGDLVSHHVPSKVGHFSAQKYKLLEDTISEVTKIMNQHIPNAFYVPCLGNNDSKFHYQPAALADEPEQHGFLFEEWF